MLSPNVRTLPFAFSEGTDVLAAPADLVVPGNWFTNGAWKVCLYPDQTVAPSENNNTGFASGDNVLIEAYRVVSPFADALVVTQPRIEFAVFGLIGSLPGLDDFSVPHLEFDYSAPWGEWMECNRFVPAWTMMGADNGLAAKYLGVKTKPVTLQTKTLDTAYNGSIVKLEVHLKVRHVYPMAHVLP